MNQLQNPLFIVGNPRSGTSLLRLILTSNSQVLIPPECGFMIWLREKYRYWGIDNIGNSEEIDGFINDLFERKKFDTWKLDRLEIKEKIIAKRPASYADLCAVIYAAFASNIKKEYKIWGDKNNYYLNHLDELQDLYRGARFLHIVRDGRDVACSYREVMAAKIDSPYAPKLETEIQDIAIVWSNNVNKINSFMSMLATDKSKVIKYENLAAFPKDTISSICEWLGVPFEGNMLTYYQQNIENKLEPESTLMWKKRTLEPISTSTVGRHARMLTAHESKMFLDYASDVLSLFDYI